MDNKFKIPDNMTPEQREYWLEQLITHAPEIVDEAKRREAYSMTTRGVLKVLTVVSGAMIAAVAIWNFLGKAITRMIS